MKYLHFELLKKYAKFAKLEFEEGKELLQKEFILRMGHWATNIKNKKIIVFLSIPVFI